MYYYPPNQSEWAVSVVKQHVEEGKVHPYVGLLLIGSIREMGDTEEE